MNIFGIGPAELILILIILLAVAGPKRMIQWAYVLGRYTMQFRKMVEETWAQIRKEFEAVDVHLPQNIPTRGTLTRDVSNFLNTEFAKLEQSQPSAAASKPQAETPAQNGNSASAPISAPESATENSNGDTAPHAQETPKTGYDAWLPK